MKGPRHVFIGFTLVVLIIIFWVVKGPFRTLAQGPEEEIISFLAGDKQIQNELMHNPDARISTFHNTEEDLWIVRFDENEEPLLLVSIPSEGIPRVVKDPALIKNLTRGKTMQLYPKKWDEVAPSQEEAEAPEAEGRQGAERREQPEGRQPEEEGRERREGRQWAKGDQWGESREWIENHQKGEAYGLNDVSALAPLAFVSHKEQGPLSLTRGNYQGQEWYIDEEHRLWWEEKPYIPYLVAGLTGFFEPQIEEKMKEEKELIDRWASKGITEYHIQLDEALGEEKYLQDIYYKFYDKITDYIIAKGGTYVAHVEPLREILSRDVDKRLKKEDKVAFFLRKSIDVSDHAGEKHQLSSIEIKLGRRLFPLNKAVERGEIERSGLDFAGEVEAYLVNREGQKPLNASEIVASSQFDVKKGAIKVDFKPYSFPEGSHLRLVVLPRVYVSAMQTFGTSAVAMFYKEAILNVHRAYIRSMKGAVAKKQLRALCLYNEIEGAGSSFFSSQEFPDFSKGEDLLAFHQWLSDTFMTIEQFNRLFNTDYEGFDAVPWFSPLVEERNDVAGVFASLEQAQQFDKAQNAFYLWRLGQGFAQIGRIVQEEWGEVPILIMSSSGQRLDIQASSLLEGLEGFGPHFYGDFDKEPWQWNMRTREDTDTALKVLDTVEKVTGKTKLYWITEWNLAVKDSMRGFHYQRFKSKEDMRSFLDTLVEKGATGFFYYKLTDGADPAFEPSTKMWPETVDWYAELKQETLQKVMKKGS